MKKTIIILCFFILCIRVPGQDTIKKGSGGKWQTAIKGGIYFKSFFGKKYISPTPISLDDKESEHQFDGFTKVPTFGSEIGIMVSYKVAKYWQLSSGLLYFNRKDIFESNIDTVYKYHYSGGTPFNSITKYEYVMQNFEIPIMIIFKTSMFYFQAGVNIPILSFKRATYTYMVNLAPNYITWGTTQKVIESIEVQFKVFPSLQVSYDLKINSYSVYPFIAIDFGSMRSYYLQGGLIIPIFQKTKK